MNYALLAPLFVIGAYLFGRIEQFFRDVKRGLGPKVRDRD